MTEGGNPSEVIIDFGDGAVITYPIEEESFIKKFIRGIFGKKKNKD
nr:MAG TPA: roadblock/LC7 domain protein [Caudoviricetes sp.]